jgi:hypothetical protein
MHTGRLSAQSADLRPTLLVQKRPFKALVLGSSPSQPIAHLFLLLPVTLTQAIVKCSVSEQESDHVFGPFISFAPTA